MIIVLNLLSDILLDGILWQIPALGVWFTFLSVWKTRIKKWSRVQGQEFAIVYYLKNVIFISKKETLKCLQVLKLRRCALCHIAKNMDEFGNKKYRCKCRKITNRENHKAVRKKKVKSQGKVSIDMTPDLFVNFD